MLRVYLLKLIRMYQNFRREGPGNTPHGQSYIAPTLKKCQIHAIHPSR